METITEDYVSFEIAKLLKEKGFDEACHVFYDSGHRHVLKFVQNGLWNNEGVAANNGICVAPTIQMVMKWLRVEYKIFICIVSLEEIGMYGFGIEDISSKKYLATSKNDRYSTYEEAVEAAIKYCLENLI